MHTFLIEVMFIIWNNIVTRQLRFSVYTIGDLYSTVMRLNVLFAYFIYLLYHFLYFADYSRDLHSRHLLLWYQTMFSSTMEACYDRFCHQSSCLIIILSRYNPFLINQVSVLHEYLRDGILRAHYLG